MIIRSKEETEALRWAKEQGFSTRSGTFARLLAGYIERLESCQENLEVQATEGIAAGWICVPEVEWRSNMPNAELTGRAEGEGPR